MESSPAPAPSERPRGRWKRILLRSLAVLFFYLAAESLLAPALQPSARLCLGMIHVYQKVGAPAVGALGGRCRYDPSCSHYAEDAIGHYGTLWGSARTIGRLLRCAPWGGRGYDPAF